MKSPMTKRVGLMGLTALAIVAAGPSAQAEDFFSSLFGGSGAQPRAQRQVQPMSLPFANEGDHMQQTHSAPQVQMAPRPARRAYAQPSASASASSAQTSSSGGGQAYCVRTCDGRYFPISGADRQSRAETCNSFCPASPTKVFYGSTIESAVDGGKRYSEMPNAYKFRDQVVDNCTCNGKDHFGLAKVDIKKDPTVRKGDIIADASGLMVAGRNAEVGQGRVKLSRLSATLRNQFEKLPVVASQ